MNKTLLTIGILILVLAMGWHSGSAQSVNPQAWNHWYFGPEQAVRFDAEPPTVLNNSQMAAWENAATISDKEGNLLLYAEGDTVWNGRHEVIGTVSNDTVKSQFSCSAGCAILRKPGQDSLYYIFTVPPQEQLSPNDTAYFKYAIVNIKARGGKGAVIEKDNHVHAYEGVAGGSTYEKLGFVRHKRKNAWWLVTKKQDETFVAYLFDENGLDPNGVTSDVEGNSIGYISFSPDGTRMATGKGIYQFNPKTGRVNKLLASFPFSPFSIVSMLAISPNGDFVYCARGRQVVQIDIRNIKNNNAQLEKVEVAEYTRETELYAFMLAPNGKIYINTDDGKYLSTIHKPNQKGKACDVELKAVKLGKIEDGGSFRQEGFGLPLTPASIFRDAIRLRRSCNKLSFTSTNYQNADSFQWQYQYPDSGLVKSTDSTFTIPVAKTGRDSVTFLAYSGNNPDTTKRYFQIDQLYNVPETQNQTATFCPEQAPLTLQARSGFQSYQWNTGVRGPELNVNKPGQYWVTHQIDSNCTFRDSFRVKKPPEPSVSLPNTDSLCQGDSLTVPASATPAGYTLRLKQSGKALAKGVILDDFGNYVVTINDGCTTSLDTFQIDSSNCTNCRIYIPNAFTPRDENRLNEAFKPASNCSIEEIQFRIFNRWGEQVFYTQQVGKGWKGRYNGESAPLGTYVYQAYGRYESGRNFFKNGTLHLIE